MADRHDAAGRQQRRASGLPGLTGIWYAQRYDATYNETKVYTITDRPVYRPDQAVKYKFWVGYAKYDLPEEASSFAGRSFLVEIHNPKGEKVLAETKKADHMAASTASGKYRPTPRWASTT